MSYLYYTQTAGVVKIVNPPFLDVWGLRPYDPRADDIRPYIVLASSVCPRAASLAPAGQFTFSFATA